MLPVSPAFRKIVWGRPPWTVAGCSSCRFFFNDTATTEIYTLSLHDALPIFWSKRCPGCAQSAQDGSSQPCAGRSEEHTSELQSLRHLVCRLLLEKKRTN